MEAQVIDVDIMSVPEQMSLQGSAKGKLFL
jgi:hypothetical protein